MPNYLQQNLGTSLSQIVIFDDAQDEAIRGFETGTVEPTVRTPGMLWRCLDPVRLLAMAVPPEITGAYLQWTGIAWTFFADVDWPCMNAAGEVPMTGPLKMGGNSIINVGAADAADEATRYDQVMLRSGANPATAAMPMGGFKITGLADGVDPQDAATMAQVGGGKIAHFRTMGSGARIDSGWTPGTTTFVQRINATAFTPERAEVLIRARIADADDGVLQDADFKVTAAVPRWRHATDGGDNGGVFTTVAGHYRANAGAWTILAGTFDQAVQSGSSPDAFDFKSDLLATGGASVRLYVRFHLGATTGVEFWLRRDTGEFMDLDEVGSGGEGIVQLFVYGV